MKETRCGIDSGRSKGLFREPANLRRSKIKDQGSERTESAYGEGYRDAKAVLEHETKELGIYEERAEE